MSLAKNENEKGTLSAYLRALYSKVTVPILVLWAAGLSTVVSALMVAHWVTLPVPEPTDAFFSEAVRHQTNRNTSGWKMLHILYSECPCSQKIFDYLLERRVPSNVSESVLLVEHHREFEERAAQRNLEVTVVTRRELKERFHVESAPLLVVADPSGSVRYAGGYTGRKQGIDYQDLDIVSELQQKGQRAPLPLYGCGVSRELQAYLDPIGMKYQR